MPPQQLSDKLSLEAVQQTEMPSSLVYLREREIYTVCEWCDDKAPIQTHVLVAVGKGSSALAHVEFIRLPVPIKTQLAFPFKLSSFHDAEKKTKGRGSPNSSQEQAPSSELCL